MSDQKESKKVRQASSEKDVTMNMFLADINEVSS